MIIEGEKDLDRKLRVRVRALKGWSIKLMTDLVRGLPDRLVLLPGGYIIFAEIKTKGKSPTPIQKNIHRKLTKMGFKVYVVDSLQIINQIFADYETRRF